MANDGGPAYPTNETENYSAWDGMTLRDYFAGQALAGLTTHDLDDEPRMDALAPAAYEIADAMLAARESTP